MLLIILHKCYKYNLLLQVNLLSILYYILNLLDYYILNLLSIRCFINCANRHCAYILKLLAIWWMKIHYDEYIFYEMTTIS